MLHAPGVRNIPAIALLISLLYEQTSSVSC